MAASRAKRLAGVCLCSLASRVWGFYDGEARTWEGRGHVQIPKNVAPRGFPTCRNLSSLAKGGACSWTCRCSSSDDDSSDEEVECRFAAVLTETWSSGSLRLVLRRKSCVMAMPMEAKAREVRSQARKVRSFQPLVLGVGGSYDGWRALTQC